MEKGTINSIIKLTDLEKITSRGTKKCLQFMYLFMLVLELSIFNPKNLLLKKLKTTNTQNSFLGCAKLKIILTKPLNLNLTLEKFICCNPISCNF